jgi:hypothetical protein
MQVQKGGGVGGRLLVVAGRRYVIGESWRKRVSSASLARRHLDNLP